MRLILMGCPGAGKGTQAKILAQKYHIPQISTGDILRTAIIEGTDLGNKIKDVVESGHLIPDEIITHLIEERLRNHDCRQGFVLDGFPRTVPQAEALQHIATMDYVIDIDVPEEEIIKRLTGRRVHAASGRTYHVLFQPPRIPDIDDVSGEPLMQRPDDTEEVVRQRLTVYYQLTEPLREFYMHQHLPQYLKIDGIGSAEEITNRILHALTTQRIIL